MSKKSLGTLTLDLVARVGGFVQGMSQAERSSAKWRRQVERDMKKAGQEVGVRMKGIAIATAGAAAGLAAMTVAGLRNSDTQTKLARSLNATFDSVTALRLAFDEGGVDGYEMSMARLNRRLGAAEMGTGEAAKTVEALNLNLKELSGLDADERVARIADAINESGASAQEAARYAQQLGFEQKEAAQFFMQGGDAIRSYRKEVDLYGLALSAIETQRIEEANDEFGKLGRATTFLQQQLAAGLAPVITTVSSHITDSFKESSDTMKSDISGAIKAGVDGMAGMVDASATVLDVISDNPMSSQFGVLGWLLLGPKGALIGAAIGATFDVIEEGMARIGIGISDAENSARMLANVQEQIQRQEQILQKARQIGHDENSQFIQDAEKQKADLQRREAELQAEVNRSTEAQDTYNQIITEGTDKAVGFSGALRRLAGSLRGIDWDNAYSDGRGSNTPGNPNDPLDGLGGAGEVTEEMEKRREAIIASLQTEKQAILAAFGERDAEISELRDEQAITEMEADNLRFQNKAALEKSLTDLTKDEAKKRAQIEAQAQATITGFHMSTWQAASQFLNIFASDSKAAALASIAITKGLAIAQTIAHTAAAKMAAMTLDPSGAMAARVAMMGKINIGIIAASGLAQGYMAVSGGGSVGTGGYSSSGTHPPASPVNEDSAIPQPIEDERRGVQINFYGNVNGLDADQISRSIKDHLETTDFVLIEPGTRNGRALKA